VILVFLHSFHSVVYYVLTVYSRNYLYYDFSRFRRGMFEIFWLYVLFSRIFLIRGKLKGQRDLWKKISINRWLTFKTECLKFLTGFVWHSNNRLYTQ